MNTEESSIASPSLGIVSERRHSLRDTVMDKLMPYVRLNMAKRDDSTRTSPGTKSFTSLVDVISYTAKNTILGRVKMDSRHMWLAKRIALSAGGSVSLSNIEEAISSPFNLSKINEFLGPFGSPCLFICLCNHSHLLQIDCQPFDADYEKMMYLVRVGREGEAIPLENFEQKVIFGEFKTGIKSLALILQTVYTPMLHAFDHWGRSTEEDRSNFYDSMSRFSATLTGIVCTIDSRAHLSRQDPGLLPALNSLRGNRDELLKQLEDVALGWKNAAESVLSEEDPALRSLMDARPDSALLFWRQRLANLNALSEEFEDGNTREAIAALDASASPLSEILSSVKDRIREATMEARENVKHLSALGKHFEVLYGGTLDKIAEAIGGIFSKVKRIRIMSKYLQDTDNMNGLLVKITNQIVLRCKAYIVGGGGVWQQSCPQLLARLKECLSLNNHCQAQYRNAKHERIGATRELPFLFDETQIFARFELFSDRLEKLIEIFDVHHFFEILASQDIIDVRHVCVRYFHVIKAFSIRWNDPLDDTDTLFDAESEKLRITTLALEKSLCKAIDLSLNGIHSTDQSLDLLSAFDKLLPRQCLRPHLNAKHIEILDSFAYEMQSLANMYEKNKDDPPLVRHAPPVAGKIIWVRQLLRLLEVPMQKFRNNGTLLISPNAKVVVKKYNKIAKTLMDYEVLWERVWCSMAECAQKCLHSSILAIHPATHELHINFDPTVIQVFKECRYMQKLEIDMPPCAQAIMEREQALKQHLNSLKYMISLCDNCKRMVQPDCQPLLQPLITEMDRMIRPGLVSLSWDSAAVEKFIYDVLDFLNRFQSIVSKIRDIYDNRISLVLKKISRCELIAIPSQICTVDEFSSEQACLLGHVIPQINQKSAEIEIAVKDCVDVALYSASTTPLALKPSTSSVNQFYDGVWELVFHAVLMAVNRSINNLKDHVRSARGAGIWVLDRPLFKVNIDLISNSIQTNPTLDDVQHSVNCCALNVLRSIQVKPWASHLLKQATIAERVRGSKEIVRVILLLTGCIEKTGSSINNYLKTLNRFQDVWCEDVKLQCSLFMTQSPSIEAFIQKLSFYDSVMQEVIRIPSAYVMGPISLSHDALKKTLVATIQASKAAYCACLCSLSAVELNRCMAWMMSMSVKLRGGVRDLDDVRNVRLNMNEIIGKTFEIEGCLSSVDNAHNIAREFGFAVPEEDEKLLQLVRSDWLKLNSNSSIVLDSLRMAQDKLRSDLLKTKVLFYREVKQFCLEYFQDGPADPKLYPNDALERLKCFQDEYDVKMRKIIALNEGEDLFGLPVCKYTEMIAVKSSLTELHQLYSLHGAIRTTIEKYLRWPLDTLLENFTSVEQEVQSLNRRILQLPEEYTTYVAFKEMSDSVEYHLMVLPMLELVLKSGLQIRHWEEIMVVTGKSVNFSDCNFSARELLELNLPKFSKELSSICASAQKESACQAKLNSIQVKWQKSVLSFQSFKGLGPILLDEHESRTLIDNIEESQISLSLLLESKFAALIVNAITQLRSNLSTLNNLLDLWLEVQSLFCSVEAVLSSRDALKQLPQEINRFHMTSKNLVSLSQDAHTLRYAMALVEDEDCIRQKLCDLRKQLEANQHCLAAYLNAKKEVFPRLFFVSDSLMLEILSCGLEFVSKKGFLANIFENVGSLILSKGDSISICAVQSREGEILHFENSVLWEENLENLLVSVDREIKVTVQKLAERMQVDIFEEFDNGHLNMIDSSFPGQICIMGFQCWWTWMCNECFLQSEKDLSSVLLKTSNIISSVVYSFSSAKSMKDRLKSQSFLENALIQKDLTQHLCHQGTKSSSSFDWQKQLRFRLNQINPICEVQSLDRVLQHNYEYTGCSLCLSIPCLSNRVFMFVFEAMDSAAGCRLIADSGTSKTDTLKDLSRKLGRFFVECSSLCRGNDAMDRFLTGVFRSGTWGCIDRLELMSSSVLAVASACFISALDALRAGRSSFIFGEGHQMLLEKTSGLFCCSAVHIHATNQVMSLPDNLKFIFRSLNVLPPDYSVFIRIKLGAAQFVNAVSLSTKIGCMYQFCLDAFADNKAYDFSFRSIQHLVHNLLLLKSTMKSAGHDSNFSEFKASVSVLRKLHLPRLVAEDVPLFTAYLSQLFDKNIGTQHDFLSTVHRRLEQTPDVGDIRMFPEINIKSMQVFESSSVRHGVILCGPTCTGKSLSLMSLISKLSTIQECPHKALHINPMAFANDHLFGWFDVRDKKWCDGVITSSWRRALRNKAINTWMIFEGPIESHWIENLHTVLDDAKVLTLANGDALPLEEYMHLVMEVTDLAACSPSTISRSAVVAFSEPIDAITHNIDAWLATRRAEEAECLRPLLAAYVCPICDFIGAECRQNSCLLVYDRSKIQCFFVLLTALLCESVLSEEILDPFVLERYVIYSLAWATIGLLDDIDRHKVHQRLAELSANIPTARGKQTVLDFELLDTDSAKQSWVPLTPNGHFRDVSAEMAIKSRAHCLSNLFVPTVMSEGLSRLNRILNRSGYPLFIAGDVGSGKSTLANRCLLDSLEIPSSLCSKLLLSNDDSSQNLQEFVFRRLKKINGRVYGPSQGKSITLLIEDVNASKAGESEIHHVTEFLRFFLERRILNPPKLPDELYEIHNVRLMGTVTNVFGRARIENKLLRFVFSILVLCPCKESMKYIFEPAFLARYSDAYHSTGIISDDAWTAIKVCIDATADLVLCLKHQDDIAFNMHSIARIRQAFIQAGPEQLDSPLAVLSLWNHECERELLDGLIHPGEFDFEEHVKKISTFHFGFEIASTQLKYSIWTNIPSLSESKVCESKSACPKIHYQPTDSMHKFEQIRHSCQELLCRYNAHEVVPSETLDLFLFKDLILHLIRLVRIFSLECGHAILVSDSGTGKNSITRLAAYFLSYSLISCPRYGPLTLQGLKDNLKHAYSLAGKQGLRVVISVAIFPNTSKEILSFLASSVACVNTDIFNTDEWAGLSSSTDFQLSVEHEKSKSDTLQNMDSQAIFAHKIQRLSHFAVLFSMTPLQFRNISKAFPTLRSHCTVNIWPPFSASSLEEYASEHFHVLASKLEAHRLEVANPYIEAELMKKIRDEEEQNVASGEGIGRWNSDDVTQAITEAVGEEARLREELMCKVRESVPKQMARLHSQNVCLSRSFYVRFGKGDICYCPFTKFCHYVMLFCDVYMVKFEEIYSKHLRLKNAVEALESCDREILSLHSAASSYRSRTMEASMLCDSILEEIKINVAEFQQEKLHHLSLDDRLRQADIQRDDLKEQALKYFEHFDASEAQLVSSTKPFTPDMLTEIAALNPPPALVTRIFDIILIFLRKPLNRITVTNIRGRACFNDSWSQVLELMENVETFLSEIHSIKYFEITQEEFQLLQPYLSDEELTVEKSRTTLKGLCAPLVRWIKSVESFLVEYYYAFPIMSKFNKIQAELLALKESICLSSQKVESLSKKVDELRKRYDDAVALRHVQESSDESRRHTLRGAQDLLKGLKPQKGRWAAELLALDLDRQHLAGNSSIVAAFLTYCGAYNPDFRSQALDVIFPESCSSPKIPCSVPLDVVRFLCDESSISQLRKEELAADDYLDQSALICSKAKTWPLLIDPNIVATKWILAKERSTGSSIRLIRVTDLKFSSIIQECLVLGSVVLVQDVDTDISDNFVDVVLSRTRMARDKSSLVKIGSFETDCHPSFRMYLITSSMDMPWSESFAASVMMVNFTSPAGALDLQLLEMLLRAEQPATFMEQAAFIASDSQFSTSIQEKREVLLTLICSLDGKILDKNNVVQEIDRIKFDLQAMAKQRGQNLKKIECIQPTVSKYLVTARRIRRILTCISKLGQLNLFYTYNISHYLRLLDLTLRETENQVHAGNTCSEPNIQRITQSFLSYISAVISIKHKPLWNVMFAMHIDPDICDDLDTAMTYLTVPYLDGVNDYEFSISELDWLSSESAVSLKKFLSFQSSIKSIPCKSCLHDPKVLSSPAFKQWYQSEQPESVFSDLEHAVHDKISPFERLLLISCLRKDRFYNAAMTYVQVVFDLESSKLEQKLNVAESSASGFHYVLKLSEPSTPIIIISSGNFDVSSTIKRTAAERGVSFKTLLTSNQMMLKNHINSGMVLGSWLIMENVDAYSSILTSLPSLLDNATEPKGKFRLFISVSTSCCSFPKCVLRLSFIMRYEQPESIRSCIFSTLEQMGTQFLENIKDPAQIRLILGLTTLYSLVQGRANYWCSGWGAPYEFREPEFIEVVSHICESISKAALKSFNFQYPWESIQLMVSELYFSRVIIDQHDKQILNAYLQKYSCAKVLAEDFEFLPAITIPSCNSVLSLFSCILQIPEFDDATMFGLPSNADIERNDILGSLLLKNLELSRIECSVTDLDLGAYGRNAQLQKFFEQVIGIHDTIVNKVTQIPRLRSESDSTAETQIGDKESTRPEHILWQYFTRNEVDRMVQALEPVKELFSKCSMLSSDKLIGASENDMILLSTLQRGSVPHSWFHLSWSSSSLTGWMNQLRNRWIQLRSWLNKEKFTSYWLGGFFNPGKFIRITILEASLLHGWQLECIGISLEVKSHEIYDVTQKQIHGICLFGGAWDERAGKLICSRGELSRGPDMCLVAKKVEDGPANKFKETIFFKAPCFKAASRVAADYLVDAFLPTNEPPQKLVLRSCALFLNSDSWFEMLR